jgi:hypothetical protein
MEVLPGCETEAEWLDSFFTLFLRSLIIGDVAVDSAMNKRKCIKRNDAMQRCFASDDIPSG